MPGRALGESPGGQGNLAPTAVGEAVSQHQALVLLPLSLHGTKGAADAGADFLLDCSLCLSHEISMTIKQAGCCSAKSCGEQGTKYMMLGCQMAGQHWTAVQKPMTCESLSSSYHDASLSPAQETDKTKLLSSSWVGWPVSKLPILFFAAYTYAGSRLGSEHVSKSLQLYFISYWQVTVDLIRQSLQEETCK